MRMRNQPSMWGSQNKGVELIRKHDLGFEQLSRAAREILSQKVKCDVWARADWIPSAWKDSCWLSALILHVLYHLIHPLLHGVVGLLSLFYQWESRGSKRQCGFPRGLCSQLLHLVGWGSGISSTENAVKTTEIWTSLLALQPPHQMGKLGEYLSSCKPVCCL